MEWVLRCPREEDGAELSRLRITIDGETEFLDREPGEDYLSPESFRALIRDDAESDKALFLVAEVDGKIVGFTRCVGSPLKRYRHKADFGICLTQDYCGHGIGKILLEHVLLWSDYVGIEKISLSVVESNVNAIKLYRKYGFIEEGKLLKDRIHSDGKYYNTVLMGRTLRD